MAVCFTCWNRWLFGCDRDQAGNRQLLFSQYAGLVLLGLFNPTMQSLQGLSQLFGLRRVQNLLGGPRASVGSLSESVRVFDPHLLQPIFDELLFNYLGSRNPEHRARLRTPPV